MSSWQAVWKVNSRSCVTCAHIFQYHLHPIDRDTAAQDIAMSWVTSPNTPGLAPPLCWNSSSDSTEHCWCPRPCVTHIHTWLATKTGNTNFRCRCWEFQRKLYNICLSCWDKPEINAYAKSYATSSYNQVRFGISTSFCILVAVRAVGKAKRLFG